MSFLTPCESCRRHVLSSDASCPFCGAAVSAEMRGRLPRAPRGLASRAAMMALGATLAATPVACGGETEEDSENESPATSGTPGSPSTPASGGAGGTGTGPGVGGAGGNGPVQEPEPMAVAEYGVPPLDRLE